MSPVTRIELQRSSTPEQIAQGLRGLVLSGELPAGRPVRESAVAADLGVSRNTVREAVRILERSGLVRYEMNRGAVVREPTQEGLRDLYQARLAIEVGAAYAASLEGGSPTSVRQAFEKLRTALTSGESDAAISADLAFHAALVASANSARLDEAFTPVLNELRLYLGILSSALGEYADVKRVAAEHEVIVDAFEGGDQARLAAEITDHIRTNGERLAAILGGSGAWPDVEGVTDGVTPAERVESRNLTSDGPCRTAPALHRMAATVGQSGSRPTR